MNMPTRKQLFGGMNHRLESAGSKGSSLVAGLAQTFSRDVYRNLIKPLKKQFGSEILAAHWA
jgi:hypothetical protein